MIPAQIEQDLHTGKAVYKTFQTGIGGQSVLKVPENSSIVIFGYEYSPAGGGIQFYSAYADPSDGLFPPSCQPFETQQISFYTGATYHHYLHHFDIEQTGRAINRYLTVNNTPITRSVFIPSKNDVTLTVGLCQDVQDRSLGRIGVTKQTPPNITYGGDGNQHQIFTAVSGSGPSRFYQPSNEGVGVDYYQNGMPATAQESEQLFFTPDLSAWSTGIGLMDPSEYLENVFGPDFTKKIGVHYLLNVHYALYNELPK